MGQRKQKTFNFKYHYCIPSAMSILGVGSGSSCCSWVPCGDSLKDRICPHWRMAAGLITLASCIIGIVCALIWKQPYLAIAYVPGAGASTYLLYLSWEFRNLKTFSEDLDILEAENKHLSTSVANFEEKTGAHVEKLRTLETSLTGFESTIKEDTASFAELLKRFAEEVKHFQSTETSFEEHEQILANTTGTLQTLLIKVDTWLSKQDKLIADLSINVTQLSRENTTLSSSNETLSKTAAQLKSFESALSELNTATNEKHANFGAYLEKFREYLEQLKNTESSAENLVLTTSEKLNEFFTQIQAWKDDERINKQIDLQQKLHTDLQTLSEQLGQKQGQLEAEEKRLKDFKEIRDNLKAEVAELKQLKEDLNSSLTASADKISQAADIITQNNAK